MIEELKEQVAKLEERNSDLVSLKSTKTAEDLLAHLEEKNDYLEN